MMIFKNLRLWSMDQQKPPRPLLWQAARILSYSTKTGTKSTLLSHPPVLKELQERRLKRAKKRRYKRRRGCEVHCIGSQQRATQSKDEPQETPKSPKSPRSCRSAAGAESAPRPHRYRTSDSFFPSGLQMQCSIDNSPRSAPRWTGMNSAHHRPTRPRVEIGLLMLPTFTMVGGHILCSAQSTEHLHGQSLDIEATSPGLRAT
jgi:hypothetical protein